MWVRLLVSQSASKCFLFSERFGLKKYTTNKHSFWLVIFCLFWYLFQNLLGNLLDSQYLRVDLLYFNMFFDKQYFFIVLWSFWNYFFFNIRDFLVSFWFFFLKNSFKSGIFQVFFFYRKAQIRMLKENC